MKHELEHCETEIKFESLIFNQEHFECETSLTSEWNNIKSEK